MSWICWREERHCSARPPEVVGGEEEGKQTWEKRAVSKTFVDRGLQIPQELENGMAPFGMGYQFYNNYN